MHWPSSLASLTAPPPPQPCLLPSRNEFRRRARFCFEWSLGNPSLPRIAVKCYMATKISPKVLPSSNRSVVAVEKGRLHTHTHTHTDCGKEACSLCLSVVTRYAGAGQCAAPGGAGASTQRTRYLLEMTPSLLLRVPCPSLPASGLGPTSSTGQRKTIIGQFLDSRNFRSLFSVRSVRASN